MLPRGGIQRYHRPLPRQNPGLASPENHCRTSSSWSFAKITRLSSKSCWNRGVQRSGGRGTRKINCKDLCLNCPKWWFKKRPRSRFYCVLPIKIEEAVNLILIRSVTEAFTEVCKLHMIWKAVPENLWFRGFSGTECFYATLVQKLCFMRNSEPLKCPEAWS